MTSTTIEAAPTKNFFVNMLTRDIELEDAILDLLDNCTDGIQRTLQKRGQSTESYRGFNAHITIEPDHFAITDNCGGITIEHARNFAFKMGRMPNDPEQESDLYTIGTYGIGMKRAMFKMGRSCSVVSQVGQSSFQVDIGPDWFESDTWTLPIEEKGKVLDQDGTTIDIKDLRPDIKRRFEVKALEDSLITRISQLYTYILKKGFSVKVNDTVIDPKKLQLRMNLRVDDGAIIPYVYKGTFDDVEVALAVGFYRAIPTEQEMKEEREGRRNRSIDAGWTVVCNDRIVLYCDKSIQTGWGAVGVPNYHTQFIAIAGFVYFRSTNVERLPLTTTKRGVDFNSTIYLSVRERMIEGLKHFTGFTNKWKGNVVESGRLIDDTTPFEPMDAIGKVEEVDGTKWKKVQGKTDQKRFVPSLPVPRRPSASQEKMQRISFRKPIEDVRAVSTYLFEEPDRDTDEVGMTAFETVLDMTKG